MTNCMNILLKLTPLPHILYLYLLRNSSLVFTKKKYLKKIYIYIYSFNSNHMWLTCRNHFGNVLYSVLTQENALYTYLV